MHDNIKRFNMDGTITADGFVESRERLINDVESSMRDEGYVPVLDLNPQFTRSYDSKSETFEFELSVYGVYVGDTAWEIAGTMNGTLIHKFTPQHKSKAY